MRCLDADAIGALRLLTRTTIMTTCLQRQENGVRVQHKSACVRFTEHLWMWYDDLLLFLSRTQRVTHTHLAADELPATHGTHKQHASLFCRSRRHSPGTWLVDVCTLVIVVVVAVVVYYGIFMICAKKTRVWGKNQLCFVVLCDILRCRWPPQNKHYSDIIHTQPACLLRPNTSQIEAHDLNSRRWQKHICKNAEQSAMDGTCSFLLGYRDIVALSLFSALRKYMCWGNCLWWWCWCSVWVFTSFPHALNNPGTNHVQFSDRLRRASGHG